jgi:hypothetical protein
MVKHQSRKRGRSNMNKSLKQSGGDLAGNPPSAWGWALGTAGDGWKQFMDSLTLQPGQGMADSHNNDLVPVKNLKAQSGMGVGPNLKGDIPRANMNMNMNMKRGGKRRHKRGGSFGAVLSQAAVPAVLLATQQSYKPRRSMKNKTHKGGRYRH